MALKEKYASALAVCGKLGMRDSRIEEGADGILRIWGYVSFGYDKDQIWDAIKAAGGASPADIAADVQVDNPTIYAKHMVEKGESLSKIAKSALPPRIMSVPRPAMFVAIVIEPLRPA